MWESIAAKLRPADAQLRIGFRHPHYRGVRIGFDHRVIVQQPDVIAVAPVKGISNANIVSSGETQVGAPLDKNKTVIR